MSILSAVSTSSGFVEGTAYMYAASTLTFEYRNISDAEIESECERVEKAYQSAITELIALKQATQKQIGVESAHIFRAQQTILEDESIKEEVIAYVRGDKVNAETALTTIFDTYKNMFAQLEEQSYNKERALDLDDVYKRVCRILLGISEQSLAKLPPNSIIVAEQLFPSDTAKMDRQNVRGFVTEKGGVNSHVAILAKSMGIPAVSSVTEATKIVVEGDLLLIQSLQPGKTLLYLNPNPAELENFRQEEQSYRDYQQLISQHQDAAPITNDAHKIIISANIGNDTDDVVTVQKHHGTSVGLYRSEFLFMQHNRLPDEETQYQSYKKVVETFKPGMVVIRTLDVGGDKAIPSLPLQPEENPFLGYRGIRIGLDKPAILQPQLRAILRASAHGNVKILFPMISSIWEITMLKQMIGDIKMELNDANIPFDNGVEIGIMIEVPSMILLIEDVATEVDFVSIGTNDLTQYLLAADRLNEKVSKHYMPYHPSVFRSIAKVVEALHGAGKWVGVCGELAGMKYAIPALIGLGVDELSMSAGLLTEALFVIHATNYELSQNLATKVLNCSTAEKIELLLIKAHHSMMQIQRERKK